MKYLVWFSAFVLAACAAIISVSGLGQLFAGAGILVMLAMGGLEMTKLVAAGALHIYWDKLSVMIRLYMTAAVVVLVMITSLGIYGFLSGGYQDTANQLNIEDTQIELLEDKKSVFDTRIENNEKLIDYKTGRATTLTELRNNQEARLDSLLAKNYITNANRVRKDIAEANTEIKELNGEVDEIMVKNIALADSSGVYGKAIAKVSADSEITGDIGPLKHISEATGLERDTVINILMLLLIFVFDPMAVSLLILGFSIREIEKDEPKVEKPKKVKKERKPWNIMGKIKSLIPKKKVKPLVHTGVTPQAPTKAPTKAPTIVPPVYVKDEAAKSAFTHTHKVVEEVEVAPEESKGIVTKGVIDEDDIPMLRGDNKGKLWFKKGKK